MLPSFSLSRSSIPLIDTKDIELADPDFHIPSHVDLLIGSNILPHILQAGLKPISHSLMAQNTIFGWVVSGPIGVESISAPPRATVQSSSHPVVLSPLRSEKPLTYHCNHYFCARINNISFHRSRRKINIHQCCICYKFHPLRFCKAFLAMSVEQRKREVRLKRYCSNCLARSHATDDCTSADVCQKCGWAHHTLLHAPNRVSTASRSGHQQGTSRHAMPASSRPSATQGARLPRRGDSRHRPASTSHQPTSSSAAERNNRTGHSTNRRQASRHATTEAPPSRTRRATNGPMPSARRILLGAVRALERLATKL